MKENLFEVSNLSVSLGDNKILSNLSFQIEKGDWIQIKGLNGEGKTTLLKTLLQLYPYSGEIKLNGKDIKEYTEKELSSLFFYVPQELNHIPSLTLTELLSLYDNNSKKEKVIDTLGLVNISDIPIKFLSKGCIHLAFIALAILRNTDIIILDDPFIFLDVENKNKILSLLKEYNSLGKTIIIVNSEINNTYLPTKVFTLSNTQLYETNLIVKERKQKVRNKPKKIYIKPLLVTLAILFIVSLLIPSNTPILLRSLWAIIAGGVFSLTGYTHSLLFRSSITTPNTIGLSSGSILGIIMAYYFGFNSIYSITGFSLLGGLITTFLLIFFSRKEIKNIQFIGLYITAIITLVSLYFYFIFIARFPEGFLLSLFGNINVTSYHSLLLTPIILLVTFTLYKMSNSIMALSVNQDIAKIAGLNKFSIISYSLILTSICLSLIIPQTGVFFILSLFVVDIINKLYIWDMNSRVLFSFIFGPIFVLFCDIITRVIGYNTMLPITTGMIVVILTSFLALIRLFIIKEKDYES